MFNFGAHRFNVESVSPKIKHCTFSTQSTFQKTLISFSYKCFYKLQLLQIFPILRLLSFLLVVNIGAVN